MADSRIKAAVQGLMILINLYLRVSGIKEYIMLLFERINHLAPPLDERR